MDNYTISNNNFCTNFNIIENNKNEYLQYYDERWKSFYF